MAAANGFLLPLMSFVACSVFRPRQVRKHTLNQFNATALLALPRHAPLCFVSGFVYMHLFYSLSNRILKILTFFSAAALSQLF